MDDPSIWIAALSDILDVMPQHRTIRNLSTMSPSELRRKAVQISKLDKLWRGRIVPPIPVTRHPLPIDALRINILPGGNMMLILTGLGDLQLYQLEESSLKLIHAIPRGGGEHTYSAASGQLLRPASPPGPIWVVAVGSLITTCGFIPSAYFPSFSIDIHLVLDRSLNSVSTKYTWTRPVASNC